MAGTGLRNIRISRSESSAVRVQAPVAGAVGGGFGTLGSLGSRDRSGLGVLGMCAHIVGIVERDTPLTTPGCKGEGSHGV